MSSGQGTTIHICECGRAFRVTTGHWTNVERDMEYDTKKRLERYIKALEAKE